MPSIFWINSKYSPSYKGLFREEEYLGVSGFYAARSNLSETPLISLHDFASKLGISQLFVKDESHRFGLSSFKVAGAIYAVHRLTTEFRVPATSVLACASAGNHGRAMAWVARKYGMAAKVYLSSSTSTDRATAIEQEGAETILVNGTYDDAVHRLARDAERHNWVVFADTSRGMEESKSRWRKVQLQIPRLIMLGYTQLLNEASKKWGSPPDIVILQAGVGSFAASIVSWLRFHFSCRPPLILACEPSSAACLLVSAKAGRPTPVGSRMNTIMAGLRCGEVSPAGWEPIQMGINAFVGIEDNWSEAAMRALACPTGSDVEIEAGESGACGLAALMALFKDKSLAGLKKHVGLGKASRVLVFNTEGATDKENYAAVLSRSTSEEE
jgi:diaminopropionate ammonia-lyase